MINYLITKLKLEEKKGETKFLDINKINVFNLLAPVVGKILNYI